MKRKSNRDRRNWRSLCEQVGADDGVDPRKFFQSARERRPHRKTLQLCGQVRRVLDLVLTGECDDDLLRELLVQDVQPAPDASRLMVTVMPIDPHLARRHDQILQRLAAITPRLRSEIANSIHRRKTPQLLFQFVLPTTPAASTSSAANDELNVDLAGENE
jgi:ribosome-binding factor A